MSHGDYIVKFRIPNGGGGIVQGMASAEFLREVMAWKVLYGETHINEYTKQGWYWLVDFHSTRSMVLFLTTFKPSNDFWMKNCSIEPV